MVSLATCTDSASARRTPTGIQLAGSASMAAGGAASTHYWVSPNDDGIIVVTLKQILPFNFNTEFLLKPAIYDTMEK